MRGPRARVATPAWGGPARVDWRPVDPFAAVLFGGLLLLVVFVWLLGRFYPGSGLEQLGMRSAREIAESREALEAEDLDQLVAARNARRRARGEPECSAEDYELQIARQEGEQAARRARYAAERAGEAERLERDRDLQELLELTNARRRARGLSERTAAQAQAELGRPADAED